MTAEERGNGDSSGVKSYLNLLQKDKQLLNEKLSKIEAKSHRLSETLDQKKAKMSSKCESKNQLIQSLTKLKDQSMALEENAKRVEQSINESRLCVQELNKQLIQKRINQSVAIDQISSEIDSLSQQFLSLVSLQNSDQICGQITSTDEGIDEEIDEEIERKRQTTSSLIQTLDEMSVQMVNRKEGLVDQMDYMWKEWPIHHRIIALEIFINERELLAEDLELINRLQKQ